MDEESLLIFKQACEDNGIVFLDTTEAFLQLYYEEQVLPNGFCNTAIGVGHLNQYGHRIIAQLLTALIEEMETDQEGSGL